MSPSQKRTEASSSQGQTIGGGQQSLQQSGVTQQAHQHHVTDQDQAIPHVHQDAEAAIRERNALAANQAARCDKVVCYDEIGCICVTAKLAVSQCSFPHLSNSNVENICVTAKLAVTVLQPSWP